MTEQQYLKEKLKVLMGGQSIRKFYNQKLRDVKTLEETLEETPSLAEKLIPVLQSKYEILGMLVKYTKEVIKYPMSDKEILEGFIC